MIVFAISFARRMDWADRKILATGTHFKMPSQWASGIGKAVAQNLLSRGITVVLSGRRQEVGDAAVSELSALAKEGAQARFVRNDVANEDAVKTMIDVIISEFRRLDMAVNNGIEAIHCGRRDRPNLFFCISLANFWTK